MKIACIGLNQNLIQIDAQSKIIDFIKKQLYQIGESVSLISYFDNNLDKLKNIHSEGFDLYFYIGTESSIYNHNIKNNLSRIFGDKLESNASCYNSLQNYCKTNNKVFSVEEETEVMLPSKSIPLCKDDYYYNGFMYQYNNTYSIFLPMNLDFAIDNYNKYILPLIKDISLCKSECTTLKCYGILEKDIKAIISEELINPHITIQIVNNRLDNAIYLRYDEGEENVRDLIASICTKLHKFIYATEDISLYKMASDLLSIQRKKLAIGETNTLGNITKNLSLHNENIISESYIFANYDVIMKLLRLDSKIIDAHGKYSVNSVYELDNLLLEKSNADISLFVLGNKDCDTCFIAIGDIDGIHVYKNKIVNSDDSLIENISDMAIFYLIKKLRQNDLQFL